MFPGAGHLIAAATTTAVAVGASVVSLIAQISNADPSAVTYAQLGTTGAVTAALVYFLRKVASGQMVFRDTAEQQAAAAVIIDRLAKLVEESNRLTIEAQKREDRVWAWVDRNPGQRGGTSGTDQGDRRPRDGDHR